VPYVTFGIGFTPGN